MLELIDISHHQGAVDFDAVAADGISGVIVKATEGRDYTDPRWGENWAALAETGLVAGAYHFARPNTDGGGAEDGEAEALHFCRTVLARCPGESFIAALDFEKSGTDPDHSAQMNIDFIAAFERVAEATACRRGRWCSPPARAAGERTSTSRRRARTRPACRGRSTASARARRPPSASATRTRAPITRSSSTS